MTRRCCAVALALAIAMAGSSVWGQETPNPEQLKTMYDEALVQLKAAQMRKNELADENEKLVAQLAELQKQLTASAAQIEALERSAADFAGTTFFLRSQYAAWQRFMERYPLLKLRWELFLDQDVLAMPARVPVPLEMDWPLSEPR